VTYALYPDAVYSVIVGVFKNAAKDFRRVQSVVGQAARHGYQRNLRLDMAAAGTPSSGPSNSVRANSSEPRQIAKDIAKELAG